MHGERSQGLVEFSLIAPLLLLFIFGVVDFGRGLYYYITLQQAANEGARVSVRASYPDFPTDLDVQRAVTSHAPAILLANPCPNGPIRSTDVPPPNQGFIYITDASTPDGSGTPNAPLGEGNHPVPNCSPTAVAYGHYPLKVTLRYNFVPLTPLIQQVTANRILLTTYAVYHTEY